MSQNEHLPETIYDYLLSHNPPVDALTRELIDETAALGPIHRMQLGVDQAAFLAFLVGLLGAKFVVEVGTFTGLSSLAMARALPEGGRILCCDISEEYTNMARRYWDRAGLSDRITLELGPAAKTLAALAPDHRVDLALLDADKAGYIGYYDALVPRLSPQGVIVADNIFMGGRVVDAEPGSNAEAMVAFAEHVQADPRTETVIIPIGDGFTLSRLAPG